MIPNDARLSVLMFCPQYPPLMGGTERQAEKLSRALVRAGCRVTVVTPHLVKDSARQETVEGVDVHRFPLVDLSRVLPVKGIGPLNVFALRAQIEATLKGHLSQAHVLHAHSGSLLSLLAIDIATKAGKPAVCKIAVSRPSELTVLLKSPLYGARLVQQCIASNTKWLAISKDIALELGELGVHERNILQIPNGVEVRGAPSSERPVSRFLYLGRLSTNIRRDVPTLLRAFDRLAGSGRNAELALVGGGDLLNETRALADACVARDAVSVPGFADSATWLEWADAFVLPSRMEGLSNALLEAMAAGLPCIANDIPPNREALDGGRAGLLTPVGDEDALLAQMQRLIDDAPLANMLSHAARSRASSTYSIDKVARDLIEVYSGMRH